MLAESEVYLDEWKQLLEHLLQLGSEYERFVSVVGHGEEKRSFRGIKRRWLFHTRKVADDDSSFIDASLNYMRLVSVR
jgi:hypothetical protein